MDNEYINLTTDWMSEKFNEMNTLLFGGVLKPCKLTIFTKGKGSHGNTLGWYHPKPEYGASYERCKKGWQAYFKDSEGNKFMITEEDYNYYFNPEIKLNGNYNWTEKAALSTLVHEMCHYYTFRDGFAPKQAHGPEFRKIAAEVSKKSNEFFTVKRIASAEQMGQMEFTDAMKEFNNRRASKGVHVIKLEFNEQRKGRSGAMWGFGYMIPASTKYKLYLRWVKNNIGTGKMLKRACDCITTDGMVKKYKTNKSKYVTWYCVGSWEEITPGVNFALEKTI